MVSGVPISIVGAGAVGSYLFGHLATSGAAVSLVTRRRDQVVLERQDGDRRRTQVPSERLLDSVPADAAAVIVTTRLEQVGETVRALHVAPEVPVLVVAPMGVLRGALEADCGRALLPLMTTSYGHRGADGVVRYWIPRGVTTRLEPGDAHQAEAVSAVARALDVAGLAARCDPRTDRRYTATMTALLPVCLGITAAGSLDELLARPALAAEVGRALNELKNVEGSPPWLRAATRLSGPSTLPLFLRTLRSVAPELSAFFTAHFGPKLAAQHLMLAGGLLGRDPRRFPALARLVAQAAGGNRA